MPYTQIFLFLYFLQHDNIDISELNLMIKSIEPELRVTRSKISASKNRKKLGKVISSFKHDK